MNAHQEHLDLKTTINLGSYYTPSHLVNIAYGMLKNHITDFEKYIILDSSCGYGSFLSPNLLNLSNRLIGVDIDAVAIKQAKSQNHHAEFFCKNSLKDFDKMALNISDDDKLIIIGNPPYNDKTSILRNKLKTPSMHIDTDIKTRDLGISFLRSYEKLGADFVCVLHPLSYLIKKSNFSLLSKFANNYKLLSGVIFSSQEFFGTSKLASFPILIALYKRDCGGMDYDFIEHFEFKIKDGGAFKLANFDTIKNYIHKYPNKKSLPQNAQPIAKFYTLRDINALRRNRTFVQSDGDNVVYICEEKFPYYCYVDVFKKYIDKLPYFLGNCDVMIDNEKFQEIKECFVAESIRTNAVLQNYLKPKNIPDAKTKIQGYFQELFGGIIH